MRLTKYQHSCLVIEEGGQKLVIDPGVFTPEFPEVKDVVAVVITHEHPDHLDATKIDTVLAGNPSARAYAPQQVLDQLPSVPDEKKKAVDGGSEVSVGNFNLTFFGHDHAVIYQTSPCRNVGIMINNTLYYPGDSLTRPNVPVKTLAVPISAPWLKLGEALEFLKDIKPEVAFPVHEAVLSDTGFMIHDRWVSSNASELGVTWQVLKSGESLEVS